MHACRTQSHSIQRSSMPARRSSYETNSKSEMVLRSSMPARSQSNRVHLFSEPICITEPARSKSDIVQRSLPQAGDIEKVESEGLLVIPGGEGERGLEELTWEMLNDLLVIKDGT